MHVFISVFIYSRPDEPHCISPEPSVFPFLTSIKKFKLTSVYIEAILPFTPVVIINSIQNCNTSYNF